MQSHNNKQPTLISARRCVATSSSSERHLVDGKRRRHWNAVSVTPSSTWTFLVHDSGFWSLDAPATTDDESEHDTMLAYRQLEMLSHCFLDDKKGSWPVKQAPQLQMFLGDTDNLQ